jgi:hypothetical protein
MGKHTLVRTTVAAFLALAWIDTHAAEPGTAVDSDPDAGASEGDFTFFGVKATKETTPSIEEQKALYEARSVDPYSSPKYENLGFTADNITLTVPQKSLLLNLLRSVATNFPQTPSYQRQMALALAIHLNPLDNRAKLADYQLRRLRDPEPVTVTGHDNPSDVAAKLWNAGFGLHRYSENEDDRHLSKCLIDLARHFDPNNEIKLATSKEIGNPAALSSRWDAVTQVPDFPEAAPEVEETIAVVTPETPTFEFKSKTAQIQILQADKAPATLRLEAAPTKNKLQASLSAEPVSALLSPVAKDSLRDGIESIDQHFPNWRDTGETLNFALSAPATSQAEQSTNLAANILTRALAAGASIDPNIALAAHVSLEDTLISRPDFAAILSNDQQTPFIIVAPENEAELLDLAILGNIQPLLHSQYIACETSTTAASLAAVETRSQSTAAGLALFDEIQQLSEKMSPQQIAANPHVQDRLRQVCLAIPGHLSASILLKAGSAELPQTLSAQGSVLQLQKIEAPIRNLLEARATTEEHADYQEASQVYAVAETDLRHLRPLLNDTAQPYATQLIKAMNETLNCFRSNSATAQSKAQSTLESLTYTLALSEAE